jgi:hypothetical protein
VEWPRLFDFRNVNLDVEFEVRDPPVRTSTGEPPFLVSGTAKVTRRQLRCQCCSPCRYHPRSLGVGKGPTNT